MYILFAALNIGWLSSVFDKDASLYKCYLCYWSEQSNSLICGNIRSLFGIVFYYLCWCSNCSEILHVTSDLNLLNLSVRLVVPAPQFSVPAVFSLICVSINQSSFHTLAYLSTLSIPSVTISFRLLLFQSFIHYVFIEALTKISTFSILVISNSYRETSDMEETGEE